MVQDSEIIVRPEPTPNPASVRFLINRTVLERGTAEFTSAEAAARSPLATRIFGIPGVQAVMLGTNFITVTVDEAVVKWDALGESVEQIVREHVTSGAAAVEGGADAFENTGKTPTEQGIIRVIENEIRPAVAMDGGDIVFGDFKEGIVRLYLRGSCSGCPSSMMTLKMGIERRLKEEFPEVLAVEAM